MSDGRRRSWWMLALAALGGAIWVLLPEAALAPPEVALPAPVLEPALPAAPPTPEPQPARAPAPPSSAAPPPRCPGEEDEAETPGFVRPSIWELLRLRVQELRDRLPQLSGDASPELRAGLRGLTDADDEAFEALFAAPDRLRDGFDVALAARIHAGMRALGAQDLEAAHEHAQLAVEEGADDPVAHALLGLAADRHDAPSRAREALTRAYHLASDEPALALAHARAQAEAARFDAALQALDVYLAAVPEDAPVRSWRARIAARAELTRGYARMASAGVSVLFERGAVPDRRLGAVLTISADTLADVAHRTQHRRRAELAVVVYADRDAMRRATCTPEWTGAVYDGVLHLDAQTLGRDDHFERVVRHEATHAQLARVRGTIPHWLNEGFAQWMEGPPSAAAQRSWARMTERRFWIPFASLEGALLVIDDPGDARLAYHQSLAMVRYLIHHRGERAIGEAIARIERGQHEDLLPALVPATGEDLLAFLRSERSR